MDAAILAAAVEGAIKLASLLTQQALASGAMTQEQVDGLLANAQSDWGTEWSRWKALPPA